MVSWVTGGVTGKSAVNCRNQAFKLIDAFQYLLGSLARRLAG